MVKKCKINNQILAFIFDIGGTTLTKAQDQEQKHLDYIEDYIKNAIIKIQKKVDRTAAEEKALDRNFFEDVRLNFSGDDEAFETAASIEQQQQLLDERNNAWQQSAQQLNELKRLYQHPFFARIDFQEKGEQPETIYIGLGSLTDKDNNFLIYDWRAPISSIYYDGGLGKVTYQTPDGEQSVNVTLKRQFLIDHGKITAMFDTNETIGDQMLLEVLNEKSSTQMKSIVTTIQKEQNQIIRDTKDDLLFVQGAAGSGKTSAVLQRVAYLLYRYRGNLTSSQVIMFSPNQLFNDYIKNVLPELGEQNMVQFTYHQYVARRVPCLQVQNLFDRFEQKLSPVAAHVSRLKVDLAFFEATQKYAQHLNQQGMRFRSLKFRGKEIITKDQIADIYYSFNKNYQLINRLEATKDELMNMIKKQMQREIKSQWVMDAVESLSEEQMQQMRTQVDQEFKSANDEYRFYARQVVAQAFMPLRRAIVRNQFLSINAQYIDFLRNVPQYVNLAKFGLDETDWQNNVQQVVTNLRNHQLAMDDTTPYLYLYDLMVGSHGHREMRFVFVDEVQDYTPYQIAYLRFAFPKARFTLLGDLNQAIFTESEAPVLLNEVKKLFDPAATKVVQLTRSYRSTQQITEFTKAILTHGQLIEPFSRQGDLPNVHIADNTADLLPYLQKQLQQNHQDGDTTVVITKTLAQAQALTKQLKQQNVPITLIKSGNQRLASGDLVIPAYLAKGLEFDAVVMWDASQANYPSESQQELVYTIATRAMHRLTILASKQLSPLLQRVPKNLYQLD